MELVFGAGVPGVHIRDPSPTLLMLPHRDTNHFPHTPLLVLGLCGRSHHEVLTTLGTFEPLPDCIHTASHSDVYTHAYMAMPISHRLEASYVGQSCTIEASKLALGGPYH